MAIDRLSKPLLLPYKLLLSSLILALSLNSMPTYAAKKACRLDLLSMPGEFLSRGLNQKKIANLMTDFYSDEELTAFRKKEKTLASNTYASNQAIARSQIYPAPKIEKHLHSIAKKILKKWPHTNPKFNIYVTGTLYYGAITTEDGAILIPAGFLQRANSEDEVAFILAHELAHLLLLHTDAAAKQTSTKTNLRRISSQVMGTLELAKNIKDNGGTLKIDPEKRQKISVVQSRTQNYYEHMRELTTEVIHPSWQKRHEDEADLLAVELMLKAGYSFEGVTDALRNMEALENSACKALTTFTDSMQSFLNKEAKVVLKNAVAEQQLDIKKKVFDKVISFSRKKLAKSLQKQALPKTHRPYPKRLKYILKFANKAQLEKHFDHADSIDPIPGLMKKIKSSSEFKQLTASSEAAYKTQTAIETNNLKDASSLIKKVSMNSQYGRLLKFRLRKSQLNSSAASQNLEIALRKNKPSLDVYHASLADKLSKNHLTAANALVKRAEKQFSDDVHFLPERIYITQRKTLNKKGETHALLGQCLQAGRDYMEGPCYAAALGVNPEFREKHELILSIVDCKVEGDTGGDVICGGDNPYKSKKGFFSKGFPKLPSLTKEPSKS